MSFKESALITFVQFSDKLLTSDSVMRDYYRRAYAGMEGYYFPEHYMEIPFWIPKVAGMLPKDKYGRSLHIVERMDYSLAVLSSSDSDVFLFSVMDANESYVQEIAGFVDQEVILGGYTDPLNFRNYAHVKYLGKIEDLSQFFEINPQAPPDYSLFEGEKCIPRLTLSEGCLFKCAFCTVPTTLTVLSEGEIDRQVKALKPLDFRLIFIDDKSFGQADNWRTIERVRQQVNEHNPDFLGFIVQTPPSIARQNGFLEEIAALGVKYVELGVETVNDDLLKLLNKSYRVRQLEPICEKARKLGIEIIPNFILGIPGDDYRSTIDWVRRNQDIIPVVNVNFLAIHYGNERGGLPYVVQDRGDRDQNTMMKSWLSEDEVIRTREVMEELYRITRGNKILIER